MLVTLTSQLTGITHSRDIDVDALALLAYMDGTDPRPIQVAFPHLSVEERECLMTGATAEEWAAALGIEHDTLH